MPKKPVNILFTVPNVDTAGSGKALFQLMRGLRDHGFHCEIACEHDRGFLVKTIRDAGFPFHVLRTTAGMGNRLKGLASCWRISRELRKLKVDVIHSFHYAADYSEALAAKMAGIPWIYTKKNMNWGGSSRRAWHLRSFLATAIGVQNTEMQPLFFPAKKNIHLIPRGVDFTFFQNPDPSVAFSQDLLIVANLVPVKGVDLVIRALAEMPQVKHTTLHIVGEDRNETGEALRHLVQEKQLSTRVIFHGKQQDIRPWLWQNHIFVLPTKNEGRKEGSPVALLEAMAAGLLVLGSDVSGVHDQLQPFPQLRFSPGSVPDLKEKLSWALSLSSEDRLLWSNRLSKHVQENHPIALEVQRHARLYQDLLRREVLSLDGTEAAQR
jgi:glycosyltransferase involved in cell wall biosynthesis